MLKTLLFFFISLIITVDAFAQYNFRRFSVGLGGGPNRPFSDVYTNKTGPTATIYTDFYFTPFVVGGIEAQIGSLRGGNRITDPHLREFENAHKTLLFTGKISLGQLLNYNRRSFLNTIKGVYMGTGAGFMYNKMVFVTRIKPDGLNNYTFPGDDSGVNFAKASADSSPAPILKSLCLVLPRPLTKPSIGRFHGTPQARAASRD